MSIGLDLCCATSCAEAVCGMQVLTSMGLLSEVPLCNIKLSTPDVALLQVDSDDLMQLPKTPQVCKDSCFVRKG